MKKLVVLVSSALIAVSAVPASANDRYAERPPVVVSPDLSAPWLLQLGRTPGKVLRRQQPAVTQREADRRIRSLMGGRQDPVRTSAVIGRQPQPQPQRQAQPQMDPMFLPQVVDYDGPHKPGTIVIDTNQNFLFLVEQGGKARRYGVGTGKPGFEWAGTHKITQKRGVAGLAPAGGDDRPRARQGPQPAGAHGGRAGKSARRTRPLSRLDALPHPRHQPALDDRRAPSRRAASACATRT